MKLLIQSIIAVIIVSGLFLMFNSTERSDYTVKITDKNFVPNVLHIKPGDTVTWINTGTQKHWPASDPHPVHTEYPQQSEQDCLGSLFDACHVLNNGEQWSFIFVFPGTWEYHDHIFPETKGVIVVKDTKNDFALTSYFKKENFSFLSDVKRLVLSVRGRFIPINREDFELLSKDEQKKYIINLSNKSPELAWAYLTFVGINDGVQVIEGHELGHVVGNMLYTKYGTSAYNKCSGEFAFGCHHGVSEEFLSTRKNNPAESVSVCSNFFNKDDDVESYIRCVHVVGYSFLKEQKFNIQDTLSLCDTLREDDRLLCYGGVFLEYPFFISKEQLDQKNLWSLCKGLTREKQESCSYHLPNIWRQTLDFNSEEVKNGCSIAPEKISKKLCARSVGTYAAHTEQNNYENITKICDFSANTELSQECLTSAQQEIRPLEE